MADMMMNTGKFKWTLKDRIIHLFYPNYIMRYLKSMRFCQYSSNNKQFTPHLWPLIIFHKIRFYKLGIKLGFSIGYKTLGYGVVIPHNGTIVVGGSNRIGNYAVLHTSTCITGNGKIIGDALYLSTGAKITSRIELGNNISVGANSVVNKSFNSNLMIAGAPAKQIKYADAWYIRDGEPYKDRVCKVENLKNKFLDEN